MLFYKNIEYALNQIALYLVAKMNITFHIALIL